MVLLSFIIVPILSGVIIFLLPKKVLNICVFAVEVIMFTSLYFAFSNVLQNGKISVLLGSDEFILGISLTAGLHNIILIALSLILFFSCLIYSMKDGFWGKEFAMLFLILQGLLCGVFLADDLFNIYVLLEVATVVVAILIMFKRDSRSIYDGMIYLLSQVMCMVFYLFGTGYMYKIFGVLSIEQISLMIGEVDANELILPFAFMMTGICLKSAFFPLFSWLPRAHGTPSAPSAVSAILSGLYVKNGIYLFFVVFNLFAPVLNTEIFFITIASITAVCGFVMAIIQTDIKLILAFHTISQIGLIAFGFSINNEYAQLGAFYHLINHAFFKSLLFLAAGMVIKQYKTRDIRKIHGVFKTMPVVGIGIVFGVLGITGAPLFNGSISKYMLQSGVNNILFEYILHIINAGTILSFIKLSHILFGKKQNMPTQNKPDYLKNTVLITLSAICLLGGVFGAQILGFINGNFITINPYSYLEKAIIYFAMVIICYFIYKYIIVKNPKIYKLQKHSLNFQQIVMCMLAFFIVTIVFTSIKV